MRLKKVIVFISLIQSPEFEQKAPNLNAFQFNLLHSLSIEVFPYLALCIELFFTSLSLYKDISSLHIELCNLSLFQLSALVSVFIWKQIHRAQHTVV